MGLNQFIMVIALLLVLATIIMGRVYDQDADEKYLDEPRFSARDLMELMMQKRTFPPNNTWHTFDPIISQMNIVL